MPYIVKDFPNQTVSTSGPNAASSGISLLDDCTAYAIFAPATTTTGLIVQVEPSATGTSWVDLKSAAVNVIVPTSGCTIINPGGFRQLRVITTSTEASPRTINITGQLSV